MKHTKYFLPGLLTLLLCVGLLACKKNPVTPNGQDTTKCDTCHIDTTKHPCDTCSHDTTHHVPGPNDTTSHNFTWKEYSIPGEGILTGCWVFDKNNIFVVGGSLWHYDGSTWKETSLIDADRGFSLHGLLSGCSMFSFSGGDYWLTYGYPAHCDGYSLEQYRLDSLHPGFLHSSWGTSSTDMYSVGDGGTILHFDGTNWTKMQSGTTKNLYSIWGTSGQNIWAAGWDVHHAVSEILHYDGSSWSEDVFALNGEGYKWGLGEVWACDSAGSHVAFVSGSQLFRKTGLSGWREDDSDKIGNRYSDGGYDGIGIRGNSPNDLVAAGNSGFIAHWNGKTWHTYPDFFDASSLAIGLAGLAMTGNTICLVGDNNGASWIAIGQR